MAAAAATGGEEASASCAASMAGRWFIALGIANEVDDVRWLIVPWLMCVERYPSMLDVLM
jgi:hypothetical protein